MVPKVAATLAVVATLALAGGTWGLGGHANGAAPRPPDAFVRRPAADPHGRFPRPRRVALLILENRSYEQVIGNPNAPYLTRLARRGALETRSYALAHPSLPNYIALTGGHTFEIHHDCSRCDTEATNFVDQLNQAGISWKGYFQSLPSVGSTVIRDGNYSAHYNPFTYYSRTRSRESTQDRIVSFTQLGGDLAARRLPRFSWIAPDLAHDGHNRSLRGTDRYVQRLVPRVLRALGPRGLLYVTWDEGKRSDIRGLHGRGGGRIALIAAGPLARHRAVSRAGVNQYALLRSLEAGFGLRTLGNAGRPSTPLLTGLVARR
jgi:phosphatidylinositol-3-phosphatase